MVAGLVSVDGVDDAAPDFAIGIFRDLDGIKVLVFRLKRRAIAFLDNPLEREFIAQARDDDAAIVATYPQNNRWWPDASDQTPRQAAKASSIATGTTELMGSVRGPCPMMRGVETLLQACRGRGAGVGSCPDRLAAVAAGLQRP